LNRTSLSRRHFLSTLTAAVGGTQLFAAEAKPRWLPLAFSTLGCPKWDWTTIVTRASEWGYAAIELRGLQGEMDLTKRPEFAEGRLNRTLRDLEMLDLKISDLGSSVRLHEAKPEERAAQLEDGKRYIDLAHRLGVPYIRVFGDRVPQGETKAAVVERVSSGLRELGRYASQKQVTVLIESHGDFCDSPTLLNILKGADSPNVALLWDAHHTVVAGKEDPAQTLAEVGNYVRHVHLKDSKPAGKDVRYVLTGSGNIPLQKIVRLLRERKFAGYYSFEWEKVWHPDIEEPEIAFPQFAEVMREYFSR
jgi:sugar phosphate isomerase/epimerase